MLTWSASSDNVGVAGYQVVRNGTRVATSTTPSYTDSLAGKAASATYAIVAYDAAGNLARGSNTITVRP